MTASVTMEIILIVAIMMVEIAVETTSIQRIVQNAYALMELHKGVGPEAKLLIRSFCRTLLITIDPCIYLCNIHKYISTCTYFMENLERKHRHKFLLSVRLCNCSTCEPFSQVMFEDRGVAKEQNAVVTNNFKFGFKKNLQVQD